MRIIRLLILFFFLIPLSANAEIIFYEDCEDAPTSDRWYPVTGEKQGVGGTFSVSSTVARSGTNSWKYVLNSTTTNDAARVEHTLAGVYFFHFNTEYWIGWSFYIPTNNDLDGGVIGQWHDRPDCCSGGIGGSANCPPGEYLEVKNALISFNALNPINLHQRGESDACSNREPYDYNYSDTISAINVGSWNDVVYHIKFRPVDDGGAITQIWINGVQVWNSTRINCTNDDLSPYFKWGKYRSYKILPYQTTVYYDEFRVGDANSSYAEVMPRGPTPDPDTTDPELTYVSPNGTFAAGSTPQTLTVSSNENATVKYSSNAAHTWADMTEMSSTGGLTHTQSVAASDGTTYTYYFIGQDAATNESDKISGTFNIESGSGGDETNLLNSNICTVSETLADLHELSGLFDGVTSSPTGEGSSGAGDIDQMTITCTLPQDYALTDAKTYGDNVGTWASTVWSMDYKVDSGDAWSDVFTDQACASNAWFSQDVSAVTQARYVRFILTGNTVDSATQFWELQLLGTVYDGGDPPPTPASGLRITSSRSSGGVDAEKSTGGVNVGQ